MAESIGKITVSIEAQTAELQEGLQRAERAVETAAKKMEDTTEGLAQKAEKSWTEFASKLGVIQQVAQIAQQAMTALGKAAIILGDESTTSMEKYVGVLDAIESSGIPVLSQAISVGTTLRGMLDGSLEALEEINRELERTLAVSKKLDKQLGSARMAASLREQLEVEKQRTGVIEAQSKEGQKSAALQLALALQRSQLEKKLEGQVNQTDRKRRAGAEETTQQILDEFDKQAQSQIDALDRTIAKEKEAAREKKVLDRQRFEKQQESEAKQQKAIEDRAKKEAETDRKRLQSLEERARKEAESTRRATVDLQTELAILQASALGNELDAQLIAIEAKFKRMRLDATDEQVAIMNEIERLEVSAAKKSKEPDEKTAPTARTASISTAIGAFTVGINFDQKAENERTTQTGLLKKIEMSNQQVADALKENGGSILRADELGTGKELESQTQYLSEIAKTNKDVADALRKSSSGTIITAA